MCWERHLDWISLAQVGRACWKRHRQERSRLMRSLAGLKPGLYKEEGEKKDSRASITAGAVGVVGLLIFLRAASPGGRAGARASAATARLWAAPAMSQRGGTHPPPL